MALSEYMPYGAPELLDGARSRMARSTLFASVTVAILVSGLGAVLARSVTALLPARDEPRVIVLLPPLDQQVRVVTSPPKTPVMRSTDVRAFPIPVADPVAPTVELAPTDEARTDAIGPGHDTADPNSHVGPIAPASDEPNMLDPVFVDEYPALVKSVEPQYTDLARDAGVEGVVRVLMLVGLDGRVVRAVIAPGGSVPMLDDAALEAARGCVFTPALSNHRAVKVWVGRAYRFKLH